MKIKCYLLFIVLIFFSLQITGQEKGSKLITIDIGGKSIVIAAPEKDFAEVGDSIRKMYETVVPQQNVLKAIFLPNDIVQKIGIEPIISERKRITIEVNKSIENRDFSENDFIDFKKSILRTMPSDLAKYTKDANQIISKLKDVLGKNEMGTPVVLATLLDTNDVYSNLQSVIVNTDNGIKKVLVGTLDIRLRNRLLFIYITNYQVNEESLTWFSNIIPIFCKSLFELNKETVPVPNISSDNSGQNANRSNPILNMFNAITDLFSKLPPITLVCLIIIIILYYLATRKLLPPYFKTNHSSVYLYFKTMSDSVNKQKVLNGFLLIIEFIFVIVIILSILKALGLPTPSDVF